MPDEKSQTDEKNALEKVGVYICHCGGNISDHVDVEQVRRRAESIPGVTASRISMFMCSDPGQEMIMEDLRSGRVNRVVVASCAPSLHELTFRSAIERAGGNPFIYDHANIREQVSWVHHGREATDKATRLVAASVAKAGKLKPLDYIRVKAVRHATVIGGGIAGLRAAKDLAERGIEVAIIEKSPFLGGNLAKLDRIAPTGEKASDLILSLAEDVLKNPGIQVHNCARIESFEGYVGNFKLAMTRRPPAPEILSEISETKEVKKFSFGEWVPFRGVLRSSRLPSAEDRFFLNTGVIIFATGFSSYKPFQGEYGWGDYPEVITLSDLIKAMAQNRTDSGMLEVNGRKISSAAMIHCVGSRQIPGIHPEDQDGRLNEYCSRTCCTATLNASVMIRKKYPGTRVFEFYRDIRTYGRGQEELYNEAAKNRVVF